MKCRTSWRNRGFSNTPSSTTCSSGMRGGARSSPAMVRHGMKRSLSAVSVPMRACTPSEMTSSRVPGEQRRDLGLVGLQLVEGVPEGRVLVGRVLQFDDGQRQAVDEQHHVRPALVLVLHDGELIDREEVVVGRVVEVEHAHEVAAERAVGPRILDRHAFDEQPVHDVVAPDERRGIRPRQLAEGFLQGGCGHLWVEPGEGLPQAEFEDDLPPVGALGPRLAAADLRPAGDAVAQGFQPFEGGFFDDGFGEALHRCIIPFCTTSQGLLITG